MATEMQRAKLADMPPREERLRRIREAAEAGQAGKDWYQRAGEEIRTVARSWGVDPVYVAVAVAATSPATRVISSLRMARGGGSSSNIGKARRVVKALTAGKSALAVVHPESPGAQLLRGFEDCLKGGGLPRNCLDVAFPNPEGMKTHAFVRNLIGDTNAVTVDTLIARGVGIPFDKTGKPSITAKRYRLVADDIRTVARELGWEPRQVMAAAWTGWGGSGNLDLATREERRVAGRSARRAAGEVAEFLPARDSVEGGTYFSDSAWDNAIDECGYGSRETIVLMSPADFIKMAQPGYDAKKAANTKALVDAGTKFWEIPRLMFENTGNGTARVTGHEGRHRSRALQAKGVRVMPVRLRDTGGGDGPTIRWTQFEGPWPTRLMSEVGDATIPFPQDWLHSDEGEHEVTERLGVADGAVALLVGADRLEELGEVELAAEMRAVASAPGEMKLSPVSSAAMDRLLDGSAYPVESAIEVLEGVAVESAYVGPMVYVRPGEFIAHTGYQAFRGGRPSGEHLVRITRGYWVAVYPVTQGRFNRIEILGGEGRLKRREGWLDDYPAVSISRGFVREYLKRMNAEEGVYPPYRLPTEAEWVFSAWDTTTGRYDNSIDYEMDDIAWTEDNSNLVIHKVGELAPNGRGLYDMIGNVWEMCEDDFSHDGIPAGDDPYRDDGDPGTYVIRGLCFVSEIDEGATPQTLEVGASLRSDYREKDAPSDVLGFRVFRSAWEGPLIPKKEAPVIPLSEMFRRWVEEEKHDDPHLVAAVRHPGFEDAFVKVHHEATPVSESMSVLGMIGSHLAMPYVMPFLSPVVQGIFGAPGGAHEPELEPESRPRKKERAPKKAKGEVREDCPYMPGTDVRVYMLEEHAEARGMIKDILRKLAEGEDVRIRFQQLKIDIEQHFLSEEVDVFPILEGEGFETYDLQTEHAPILAYFRKLEGETLTIAKMKKLGKMVEEHAEREEVRFGWRKR